MNTSQTLLRKTILLLTLLLVAVLAATTPGAAQGPEAQIPNGNPNEAPLAGGIVHGAFTAPITMYNTEIAAYNSLVGKDAGVIKVFYPWDYSFDDSNCGYFDHLFGYADARGCGGRTSGPLVHPVVMLTWEPLRNPVNFPSCQIFQNGHTQLEAIINGSCDGYIDDFARRLKGWAEAHPGDRFMIRFAHEMNIAANPWWTDDPAYPERYKQAFRRLHARFTAIGAKPYAQFVWSPNNRSFSGPNRVDAWNAIPNYYPGDQYVDWIGLSGFNWYTNQGQPWLTFRDLFEAPDPQLGNKGILAFLHCTYRKPIMLAEWGTVEGPGGTQSKAAWITDAFTRLKDFPFVKAVVWFDYYDGNPALADFRVTQGSYLDPNPLHIGWRHSIGAPTDAYRAALSAPAFISTMPSLAEVTPTSTYCGSSFPPVTAISIPGSTSALPGTRVSIPISMEIASGTYTLGLNGLPGGYSHTFSPEQLGNGTTRSQLTINIPSNAQVGTSVNLTITASGATAVTASLRLTIADQSQARTVYLPSINR